MKPDSRFDAPAPAPGATRSGLLTGGLLGAALLLGAAALAQRPGAAPTKEATSMNGSLTRDGAVRQVKGFLQAHKVQNSPGLNDKNLGGAEINGQLVYFEYLPERRVLKSSALVYRFRKPPRPGVLDGFRREEQAGTDAGGGTVEYMTENGGLYLTRTYAAAVPDAQFAKDQERLMAASGRWGNEVLERVSAKVFHPEEGK